MCRLLHLERGYWDILANVKTAYTIVKLLTRGNYRFFPYLTPPSWLVIYVKHNHGAFILVLPGGEEHRTGKHWDNGVGISTSCGPCKGESYCLHKVVLGEQSDLGT